MLDYYRGNDWMLNEHWPLNEPHVRLMLRDIMSRFPPFTSARVLDVGCFNGYISVLLKQLGYEVTGTDACQATEHRDVFCRSGVKFVPCNMNELDPFKAFARDSFEVVIIAQVIEHILNFPLGLIRGVVELMTPRGLLILTTPNPTTVMGAVRLLKGRSLLWGTQHFIDEPKIDMERVISKADIHYREYTTDELSHLIEGAGLLVERKQYLGLGLTRSQSLLKRFVKKNSITKRMMSRRLFASNHYVLANKPPVA